MSSQVVRIVTGNYQTYTKVYLLTINNDDRKVRLNFEVFWGVGRGGAEGDHSINPTDVLYRNHHVIHNTTGEYPEEMFIYILYIYI